MSRFPIRPALAPLGALALLSLAACAPTATVSVTPTATTAPAPTATAVLPTLAPDSGWHVVLTLGNASGKPVVDVGGSFTATKPYRLRYACEGAGTFRVEYPAGSETSQCGATPEPIVTVPFPPPPGDGQVTINTSTEGAVMWEAIVEMQD